MTTTASAIADDLFEHGRCPAVGLATTVWATTTIGTATPASTSSTDSPSTPS